MRAALLTASLSATTGFACAPLEQDEPEGAAQDAIRQGTVDDTHRFAVGIDIRGKGDCSGTLIAQNLVLTARHCVAPEMAFDSWCESKFGGALGAGRFTVTTDGTFGGPNTYKVVRVFVPESDDACGDDIALLTLAKSVPSSDAKPAVPLLRPREATRLAAIGYGRTSANVDHSEGTRRIRRGIAMRTGADPREFSTGGVICKGDSGGGAYIDDTLDSGAIVRGVAARAVFDMADGRCAEGHYTRTEAHAGWLKGVAQWAAKAGSYPVPAWAK